ncbi:MAG TPA: aldo/keto reductase [Kofleriaceae bacterium]|nr:aldo/keto reductase [Kofleriaceae bacterium]
MNQRALGTTMTTVIGVGDVRLATADARGVDARELERALHRALELGIALVDVSEEPDAERMCGDAIRSLRLRDTVMLATRIPLVAPRPGAPRRDVLPERLPARYVQERVEASLRATRLDVLPLVQLPITPSWRSSPAWPELAGTCMRLVREGKALQWAAALDPVADSDDARAAATAIADEPWLAALAVPLSLCERSCEFLVDGKRTILARRPLAGGALAGTLGPGVKLPPRDDRRALDDATLERISVAIAKLAPLVRHEPPAARSSDAAREALDRAKRPRDVEASTVAELALRYVLDNGAFALPRLHRRDHLDEALAIAAAPPLSDSVRTRLDAIFA